ncbi:uncharacterized protein LOC141601249 [Silene latifolia]|uniref:uncharacterized protein LOC141601249 n=1 Tax=Silene latifolia TaxID=37657 RepID=UPI003D76F543
MKVDLQKAYDSVEWSFLHEMLDALDFPTHMVELLMQCVSITTYSISLNDDLIIFCRGDRQSMVLLLRAFKTFSKESGLNMNHSKSNIYRNGVEESTMMMLERISGMRRGKILFNYLGVNITPKRLGVEDCHCLIEIISARIQGLGARKLDRAVVKFLWHGNDSKGSLALVAWDQVCQSAKKGRLGLKHLYWWNVAAVAKYHQDWFAYTPGFGASWAWKKICWVKGVIKLLPLNQGTGAYTIKQGYHWLVEEGTDKEWYPWISNSLIIPRHKFYIWLISQRRLLTMDRLMRMGIVQDNVCYLCDDAAESLDHLFFQCPFSSRCLSLMQD